MLICVSFNKQVHNNAVSNINSFIPFYFVFLSMVLQKVIFNTKWSYSVNKFRIYTDLNFWASNVKFNLKF